MPYFLDQDFYTQATSVKSSLLNNAFLPVPAQGWKTNKKTLIQSFNPPCLQLFPENIEIRHTHDVAQLVKQGSLASIESFESEGLPHLSLEEDTEVIPSSFPDSDTSSQFHLNASIIKYSLREQEISKIGNDISIYKEEFCQVPTSIGFQFLETPVLGNPYCQALAKVLVHKVLIKRLKVFPVTDPLLKPDNMPWVEADFFNNSHEPIPFEVPSCGGKPKEIFLTSPIGEHGHVFMEELMMPAVNACSNEAYMDNIPNVSILKEKLDFQHDHCGPYNVPDVNFEFLKADEMSIESLDGKPLLEFHKRDDYNLQDKAHAVLDRNRSPLFGLSDIRMEQKLDDVTSYLSSSSWREMLEPFKKEDLLKKCTFLTRKDYKKLKVEMREFEEHFGEEILPEPILHKQDLPHPVEEAKKKFPTKTEEEFPLHKEDILRLFKQLQCVEDPYGKIAMYDCDLELQKPLTLEKFIKTALSYGDDLLNLDITKDDDKLNPPFASQSNTKETDTLSHDNREPFGGEDDPLESFMYFRSDKSESSAQKLNVVTKVGRKEKHTSNSNKKKNDSETKSNNPEPVENTKNSVQISKQKIVNILFTGPYENVVKHLEAYVIPHFDKVKQKGLIPNDQTFYATTVDSIRFLLKETELQSKEMHSSRPNASSTDKGDLTMSLNILLCLRQAIQLLIHSSLQSAITHITSFNPVSYLEKTLLQYQRRFQEQNSLHPKFEALLSQCLETDRHDNKMLVLVQYGLMSLVSALEKTLSQRTTFSVQFIKTLEAINSENLPSSSIVISFDLSVVKTSLKLFDLVVQYDACNSSVIKTFCEQMDKDYVGLISGFDETKLISIPRQGQSVTELKYPIIVIGSVEMMQHRQLVYVMESRYNIHFIERNYSSLKFPHPLHYADIIFSLEVCLMLLPLLQIGTEAWDMETFSKGVIAMGLQTKHCFILVHGIGAPSKYLLDKLALQNIYRLRAALSNLSCSSASFVARYKILVALTQEDVALNMKSVAQYSLSFSPGNDGRNSRSSCSYNDERHWLKADMTQEEAFLLQFVCLNSFSSQLLLSKFNLEEILTCNPEQIKEKIPEFPENVLMYFHHLISKLKSDQFNSSSSSSMSVKSTSQKSACSSISNPNSEVQILPSSPPTNLESQPPQSVSSSSVYEHLYSTHVMCNKQEMSCESNNLKHPLHLQYKESLRDDVNQSTNRILRNENIEIKRMGSKRQAFENKENELLNKKMCDELNSIHNESDFSSMETKSICSPSLNIDINSFDNDRHKMNYFQSKKHDNVEINRLAHLPETIKIHSRDQSNVGVTGEKKDLFFLGKSQNSPQQTIKSEIDDREDGSFFLGKSQGSPSLPYLDLDSKNNISPELQGYNMTPCSLIDLYDDGNRSNGPEVHSSSSMFSLPCQQGVSTPALKSNMLSKPIDRVEPSSNRLSPSQYSTPSGSNYGVFSAKVGRQVKLPSVPETSQLPTSNTRIYDDLFPDIETAKGDNRFSMRESSFPEQSVYANDTVDNRYLMTKNSDFLERCLWNKTKSIGNSTQLPFAVAKDLKRHIRQTNSSILGQGNRLMDTYHDGVVYGERITRKPFILKDIDDETVKSMHFDFESQNHQPNNRMLLNDQDKFNDNRHLHSLPHQGSSKQDKRQFYLNANQNLIVPEQNLIQKSNYCHQTVKGSNLPVREPYDDDRDLKQNNVKAVTDNFCIKKENVYDILNMNLTNHHSSSSPYPDKAESTKQSVQQSQPVTSYYGHDNIESFNGLSCKANTVNNDRMEINFSSTSSQNKYFIFPTEISMPNEVNCLNQPNTITSQELSSHEFMERNTSLTHSNEPMEHGMHNKMNNVQTTLRPTEIWCGRSEPMERNTSLTHSNEPMEHGMHNKMNNVQATLRPKEIWCGRSEPMERNSFTNFTYSNEPTKHETYNKIRNTPATLIPTERCNTRSEKYLERDLDPCAFKSDFQLLQQSHLNNDIERQGMSNTNYSRSHWKTSNYSRVTDLRREDDQERQSSFPTSNVQRIYNLPYTPRRTVSVGLAQPLQRNNTSYEDSQRNSTVNQTTIAHLRPTYPSSVPLSSHSTNTFPSPPMDLEDHTDNQRESQIGRSRGLTSELANKMKKWNDHLQRHAIQQLDCSNPRDQQQFDKENSSHRQKRLCLEKTDGKKGQMVLVFK